MEIRELKEWLDDSIENEKAFVRQKKLFTEIQTHFSDDWDADSAYQLLVDKARKQSRSSVLMNSNRIIPFLKYAAVILLLIATGTTAFFIGEKSSNVISGKGVQIDVPFGSTSMVNLPDGSIVSLNAGSQLSYDSDFNSKSRDVYLVGEALFHVEKQKNPFIVHTSHLDVHVTGTTFNIKSYPDDDRIETTVIEGEVRIETVTESAPIFIKPNQKLQYQKSSRQAKVQEETKPDEKKSELQDQRRIKPIVLYSDINTEETISWQSGVLYFEGENLIELTRKLERKFDVKFQFEDELLEQYSYSGTILDLPLEQVLEAIKLTSPVNYVVLEKTVVLSLNQNFKGNS